MKYLHDPVESSGAVGPQQAIIAHVVIFAIGFAATEAICAAVILEKIPCYEPGTCGYTFDCGTPYQCLCLPGPVQ